MSSDPAGCRAAPPLTGGSERLTITPAADASTESLQPQVHQHPENIQRAWRHERGAEQPNLSSFLSCMNDGRPSQSRSSASRFLTVTPEPRKLSAEPTACISNNFEYKFNYICSSCHHHSVQPVAVTTFNVPVSAVLFSFSLLAILAFFNEPPKPLSSGGFTDRCDVREENGRI